MLQVTFRVVKFGCYVILHAICHVSRNVRINRKKKRITLRTWAACGVSKRFSRTISLAVYCLSSPIYTPGWREVLHCESKLSPAYAKADSIVPIYDIINIKDLVNLFKSAFGDGLNNNLKLIEKSFTHTVLNVVFI